MLEIVARKRAPDALRGFESELPKAFQLLQVITHALVRASTVMGDSG